MNQRDIQDYADELGRLKAEREAIQAREAEIKLELFKAGVKHGEGEDYAFEFVQSVRRVTDWERIVERYNPSRQLVTAHTVQRPVDSLRVEARG